MKSRRMRWAGRVTSMGRGVMDVGFWWESEKEKEHKENVEVDGRIMLKWIFER
jgi:hypothetical protein